MKNGIDRLIADPGLRAPLAGKRVALLAHPASVTAGLVHSLDALAALPDIKLSSAFGPQHGLRGDKQDNMMESPDFADPIHGIPVFSLYGEVRRPTDAMMASFDVMLVDLQDLGTRIYTFVTTLLYVLEAAAKHGKTVWVLDRPNPVGRPVEGLALRPGWESFVGAGPMPMRHGMTLGELGHWFIAHYKLDVDYAVVTEGQEALEHALDARDILRDHLGRHQLARLVLEARVADLAGAAAHQHDRLVARLLHPPQHHDLHHRADMERGRRRVETDIAGHDLAGGEGIEPFRIGELMDIAPFIEQAQQIGCVTGHGGRP